MSQSVQEISTEAESIVQLFPIEENLDEIDLHPELIFAEQDLRERQEMLLNWVDREEKNRLFYDSDLDKTYSDIIEAIKNVAPSTFDRTFTTANSEEHDGAENWNTQIDRLDLDLEIFRQKYREVLYKDNDPTLASHEVSDSIVLPASSQEAPKSKRKNVNTTTKNKNATKKRKTGENNKVKQEKKKENIKVEQDQTKENIEINNHPESQNAAIKQEESEDCIDIETVSDEIPVLQAPDAESLLEQFEASQIPMPCNKSEIKRNSIPHMNSAKAQQVTKKEDQSNMLKKSRRTCMPQKTSPPQEVIDRIKLSTQVGSEAKCTNAKMNHRNLVSIHREHDYCRTPNCSTSTGKILNLSNSTLNQNKMINKICKTNEHDINSKKHFTTLEKLPCNTVPKLAKTTISDETNQATPLQQSNEILSKPDKTINDTLFENKYERCQKIPLKQFQENNSSSMINVNVPNKLSKKRSVCAEKKIRSALAESIIRSRNNMKAGGKVQMVSVLKKPPNVSQLSLLNNSPSDNVASSPSSVSKCLEQVQNSVVQNTPELPSHEEEKKQPRKKLGLAEYRNRRDLNSSSKTNSPTQRIPLHYIYHAYTTTEPLRDTCGTGDRIWSEREYTTSVSENKARNKAELLTRSIGIQTGEDDMECSKSSVAEGSEERKGNDVKLEHKTEESPDNRHNLSSSSSKSSLQTGIKRKRSRSRSQSVIIIGTYDSRNKSRSRSNSRSRRKKKSRSKRSRSITISRSRSNTRSRSRSNTRSRSRSYTRSRSRSNIRSRSRSRSNIRSRSRSRSRSHRYSNTRQRRLSNRRSSVSSTSSWSSRSGKTSRSSSKSKTSPRYRSRSRSPRSNFRRSKRLNRYRSNERERNYDKYQRHSSRNHYTYRDSRSPPKHSYRRSYNSDRYNREKMTEVEERKIIFVGGLTNESEQDLHDRFKKFGPIKYINLPTNGNDFGFITFCNREDAWHAKEHGNDDPSLPKYNLSFGGRKLFCKAEYADLDDVSNNSPVNRLPQKNEYEESNYLALLREFQADTKFKKKV